MRNASGYYCEKGAAVKKQSEQEHKHLLHKTRKWEAKRSFTF